MSSLAYKRIFYQNFITNKILSANNNQHLRFYFRLHSARKKQVCPIDCSLKFFFYSSGKIPAYSRITSRGHVIAAADVNVVPK